MFNSIFPGPKLAVDADGNYINADFSNSAEERRVRYARTASEVRNEEVYQHFDMDPVDNHLENDVVVDNQDNNDLLSKMKWALGASLLLLGKFNTVKETPVVETTQDTPVVENINETPVVETTQDTPVVENINKTPVIETTQDTPVVENINETSVNENIPETPVFEISPNSAILETINKTDIMNTIADYNFTPTDINSSLYSFKPLLSSGNHSSLTVPRLDAKPSIYGEPLISAPTAVLGVAIAAAAVKGYNALQFYIHGPSKDDLVKRSAKITEAQYNSIANDQAAKLFIYHTADPIVGNASRKTISKASLRLIRKMDVDMFHSFATNSNIQRDFMNMDNESRIRFIKEFNKAPLTNDLTDKPDNLKPTTIDTIKGNEGMSLLQKLNGTIERRKSVTEYDQLVSATGNATDGIFSLQELDKSIERRKSVTAHDQEALEYLKTMFQIENLKDQLKKLDQ